MDEVKAFLAEHPNVKVKQELKTPEPKYLKPEYPKGYVPLEDEEQADFVRWLDAERPDVKYFAVPNGGKRGKREAGRFKAGGVKAGVPDLVFPEPRGCFHGLFIEMKRIKGSKLKEPDQLLWRELLTAKGYCCSMAEGAEKAKIALEAYLMLGPFDWARRVLPI